MPWGWWTLKKHDLMLIASRLRLSSLLQPLPHLPEEKGLMRVHGLLAARRLCWLPWWHRRTKGGDDKREWSMWQGQNPRPNIAMMDYDHERPTTIWAYASTAGDWSLGLTKGGPRRLLARKNFKHHGAVAQHQQQCPLAMGENGENPCTLLLSNGLAGKWMVSQLGHDRRTNLTQVALQEGWQTGKLSVIQVMAASKTYWCDPYISKGDFSFCSFFMTQSSPSLRTTNRLW